MLDINFIRQNLEKVKNGAKNKGYEVDFEKLLKLDDERRELIVKIDELRAMRNKIGKDDREKGLKIKKDLQEIEPKQKEIEKEFMELLLKVPNIPSDDSPIGKSEKENVEIKKVGDTPKFDFKIKDHVELGEKLNIIDLDRAVKIGGTRSYILKNELTILEQSILRFAIDKVREKGFEIMNVPILVDKNTLIGAGFFPFGREDVYEVNEKDKFLVGTSEASLVFYHSGEILEKKDLPRKLLGITTCFRKEAGTYGKDTKGIIRVHQFNKVEQVVLCNENDGEKMFDFILGISESIVKDLKLPYRLMRMCTGDMGPKNYKQIDLEVWFPAQNKYRETHSCSYLTDYQGRRSNIRYNDSKGKKHFVHTLNNTAIATPRILAALMENYQQKDGSIKIPEVLQKYTGFKEIK
jgi:seryl-tRNA synthetase